jgi:hypothetical protein
MAGYPIKIVGMPFFYAIKKEFIKAPKRSCFTVGKIGNMDGSIKKIEPEKQQKRLNKNQ